MAPLEGFTSVPIKLAALISDARRPRANPTSTHLYRLCSSRPKRQVVALAGHLLLLVSLCSQTVMSWPEPDPAARHHAHYLNIIPSTHFSYSEGRSGIQQVAERLPLHQSDLEVQEMPHIYKRSSALLAAPPISGFVAPQASLHYAPLVGSSHSASSAPISRRMMSEANLARAWLTPVDSESAGSEQSELQERQAQPADLDTASSNHNAKIPRNPHQEAELLRQKQHIQYHDQWPSTQGRCHKRTLNFCASVLPFNTTTFPNIIGDNNRFEVKRSLPFFGFLAKSSCNKRLDELLCLLLEPPCQTNTGLAIPPCKKFCRLALEGCNEYIPATLAMSSVFDCRQYPDSNDPQVCINLAQGSKCAADEFKCPDKTCIPRNWLCDGVRDCIFAADEANCTDFQGADSSAHGSVCSTEEFKCDGKCVPKAWKCDGERDCLDNSDEESCDQRPRCGPDRFRCSDGNGCIPKRWVCDGKAECRDGSDETNCEQRECSEADFKCDNGICIPKLWRCDRQADCKDGSDERNCIYLNATTGLETTSGAPPSSTRADYYATSDLNAAPQRLESQVVDVARIIKVDQQESVETTTSPATVDSSTWTTTSSSSLPTTSTLQTQPAPRHRDQSLDLNRFDYDIIQGVSSVPHVYSSTPVAASLAPVSGPPVEFAQQVGNNRQQRTGNSLRSTNERVPIYRSLFKTLKGGSGKLQVAGDAGQQATSSGHRYPLAVPVVNRRKRERTAVSKANGSPGHGVASYLQLLNSRHNLRLARVAVHQQPHPNLHLQHYQHATQAHTANRSQ